MSTTRPFAAFELPLDADDGPFGPSATAQGWWWKPETETESADSMLGAPSTAPRFTRRPTPLAPDGPATRSRSA